MIFHMWIYFTIIQGIKYRPVPPETEDFFCSDVGPASVRARDAGTTHN